jgi:hypothetical protein
LINSYIKLLLIALFATIFTIGCAIIIYIQAVYGSTTNSGNGSSLQSDPRTATLIVIKNNTFMKGNESVPINNMDRSFITANDFIIHVNGNNPSPFEFAGSESGTNVSIAKGPYAVTETKPQISILGTSVIISSNYSKDCTEIIKDRETKTCKISDTIHFPT